MKRECHAGAWIFGLAVLTRVTYLAIARPPFEGYQWAVADTLVRHGVIGMDGVPLASYDPLYPAFIAAVRVLGGNATVVIQVLQLALASAGAAALHHLTRTLTGSRRAALIAGVLYACYPLLIHHAVTADEFSLLAVLLILFAHLFITAVTPARAAAAGMVFGIAFLTRAMVAPILVLALAGLVTRRRWSTALVLVISALAVTAPWLMRNYMLRGVTIPARSGENLFLGNSRYAAAMFPAYQNDILGEHGQTLVADRWPHLADRTPNDDVLLDPAAEQEVDRAYTMMAWEEIHARPLATLRLKLRFLAYFFWPRLVPSRITLDDTRVDLHPDGTVTVSNTAPRPLMAELAYSIPYCLVGGAALVGVWMRRRQLVHDAILGFIVVTFVAIHVIYFPATRYRVPMEFVLLFYAAVAVDAAYVRFVRARAGASGHALPG